LSVAAVVDRNKLSISTKRYIGYIGGA